MEKVQPPAEKRQDTIGIISLNGNCSSHLKYNSLIRYRFHKIYTVSVIQNTFCIRVVCYSLYYQCIKHPLVFPVIEPETEFIDVVLKVFYGDVMIHAI
jgi:hypothetical protein